jgi:hypothetical protein
MRKYGRPIRLVRPRLWTALGTIAAASLAASTPALAGPATHRHGQDSSHLQIAASDEGARHTEAKAGEGSEGGGSSAAVDEADFLAMVAALEGKMRAGLRLYQTGDVAAAKAHMGHALEVKFHAVEHALENRGFTDLEALIEGLADATDGGKPLAETQSLAAKVADRIHAVPGASEGGMPAALRALALLTRDAAKDYAASLKDGRIVDLHEYQDAWGYLRTVEAMAEQYAASDKADVAEAGGKILAQVCTTDPAFGDIQGQGVITANAALLYAAAARMEIAALGVK